MDKKRSKIEPNAPRLDLLPKGVQFTVEGISMADVRGNGRSRFRLSVLCCGEGLRESSRMGMWMGRQRYLRSIRGIFGPRTGITKEDGTNKPLFMPIYNLPCV